MVFEVVEAPRDDIEYNRKNKEDESQRNTDEDDNNTNKRKEGRNSKSEDRLSKNTSRKLGSFDIFGIHCIAKHSKIEDAGRKYIQTIDNECQLCGVVGANEMSRKRNKSNG